MAKKPVRTPDTLNSNDTLEVLLGICEGPIKGLVNGPKSFYLGTTAMLNADGTPNFSNFELEFWPGSDLGHDVALKMGGFGNPITVNTHLTQGQPVTRTGVSTNIGAIDFRINVQTLVKQDDKGIYPAPLSIKFEIKKTTDTLWQPAWISEVQAPLPDQMPGNGQPQTYTVFGEDRNLYPDLPQVYEGLGAPSAAPPPATAGSDVLHVDTTNSTVWSWSDTNSTWAPVPVQQDTGDYKVLSDGRRLYVTAKAPSGARAGDLWRTIIGGLTLVWNGTTWVEAADYVPTTASIQSGVWSINGKATSPTSKEFRVYVAPDPDAIWEFRVTKTSQDSDTLITSEISWESVTEKKLDAYHFTNLAMVRLMGQASDQFNSIPEMVGDYDLRIVRVPSNYDPETRVYTGVWDGTYKMAWTNNTAWVFQDFVENTTYGLSSVFPHTCNKWRIYEWAKHCDTLVDRADGTKRPRWTFNDLIREPRDAREMAQYIAGAGGARMIDDGNGVVDVIVDRDDSPVMIFTPENVSEDGFVYSYTDRLTRSNEILVEFVNPKLNWEVDKRRIADEDDIETYGRISETFIAVGCTDEDEALARARRRLIGGLTEKELVTFKTNRQGAFLSEWDVILVADPEMGRGITGRIRSRVHSTSVTLRDPVTFEAAISYYATFTIVNPAYPETSNVPYKTVKVPITNLAGTHTQLYFGSPLPADLPEYATFAIEAEGYVGMPKPYRITGIDDDSGEGEVLTITAVELNRNKYVFIDTGVDQGDIDYGSGREVAPPTNLKLTVELRQKGLATTRVATLTWTRSTSPLVRRYRIGHMVNGQRAPSPGEQSETLVEFDNFVDAEHLFSVTAVDIMGRESKPALLAYNSDGVDPIVGLFDFRLTNAVSPNTFQAMEPQFAWDPIKLTPNFDHYEILILEDDGQTIIRSENVGQALAYTYLYESNKTDHAGDPPRTFKIGLRAANTDGTTSDADVLTITNPPPPAPAGLTTQLDGDGMLIRWKQVTTPDYGGTRIYTLSGPGTLVLPANLQFEGEGVQARIPTPATGTYRIGVGHYDLYKPSETIFGMEISEDVDQLVREELDALAQQIEDFQNSVGEAMEAIEGAAGLIEGQEQLAEQLISARLATIGETEEREKFGAGVIHTIQEEASELEALAYELHLGFALTPNGQALAMDTTKLLVNGTQALSERLSLIEARFAGESSSTLLDAITLVASSAETSARRLTTMISETADQSAVILNLAKTFIGANGVTMADYIQNLSVNEAEASAIANTQITAQLGPGGSISSIITGVSTTAQNAYAQASLALSTANGNTASIAAVTVVGSRITGFRINGSAGSFTIEAGKLILVDPNGGSPVIPFSVINGLANFANPISVFKAGAANKLVMGPAFGSSSDMILWFGNANTAVGSASRGNALMALCTDGTIVLPGSNVLKAYPNTPIASGSRPPGAGNVITNVVTAVVSGGSGNYSGVWTVPGSVVANVGSSGLQASFTRYLKASETEVDAYALCTVTDNDTGQKVQFSILLFFSQNV